MIASLSRRGYAAPMPRIEPRTIEKPWGREVLFAEGGAYAGKLIFIRKGEAMSRQFHHVKRETLLVLEGLVQIEIGEHPPEVHRLRAGDGWHIEAGDIHRLTALDDARLVEVSTPELMDLVRLEDRYGREGTSKP